jgi:hypothetical protein
MAKLQMSRSLALRLLFICVGVVYALTQLPYHLRLAFFSAPSPAGVQEEEMVQDSLYGAGDGAGDAGFGPAFHVLCLLAGLSTIASGLLLLKQQMFPPSTHLAIVVAASSEEEEDDSAAASANDQLLEAQVFSPSLPPSPNSS